MKSGKMMENCSKKKHLKSLFTENYLHPLVQKFLFFDIDIISLKIILKKRL